MIRHYSEDVIHSFEKISGQQKNAAPAFHLIDSLYNTFPYISAADKYRYYDFKRALVETFRLSDRSYDTAIIYVDSMIAVIENDGLQKPMHSEYAKAFSARGEYFTRRAKYSEAIRDIDRSKQLNKEAGDACLMAENTKTLSSIAIKESDYALAASLMKEALTLAASCKNDQQQFVRMQRYLDDLGFIYASSNNYDSALFYHSAAVKYVENNRMQMAEDTLFPYAALENIYGNMSVVYLKQNKYAEAETYLKKAMEIDENILHNNIPLAQLQYLLGLVYLKSGRINEAEAMAQRSAVQENNFDLGSRSDLLKLKADIAKAKQQYKEEAGYRMQLGMVKDTIYQGRIELLKKNPFTEYEDLDRKYQLELLKKDNRIQQNKITAAIVIGILLTLLAAFFIYFIWRLRSIMKKRSILYKQLKKTMEEKEIAEKQLREKELFALEMKLLIDFNYAILEQRRQISADMHDELSSSLAALKFYVSDVRNHMTGTVAEMPLTEISEEVNSVYDNARRYMHKLRSNEVESHIGLIDFLKEIQQKFEEKELLKIKLDIQEDALKNGLTAQQHDQLYHIIKESIANVIKHSNASDLSVSILLNNGKCDFSISDNGKGYDKDNIVYGIGINSMLKRIKELGGDIEMDSSDTGTTIKGYFPI